MLNRVCAFLFIATIVFSKLAPQAALPEIAPEFAWAVSAGGKGHDKTRCLAVDPRGNVFLVGEFVGTAQFGEHAITSAGDMDFFVAKCSPDGKFLWARSAGGRIRLSRAAHFTARTGLQWTMALPLAASILWLANGAAMWFATLLAQF